MDLCKLRKKRTKCSYEQLLYELMNWEDKCTENKESVRDSQWDNLSYLASLLGIMEHYLEIVSVAKTIQICHLLHEVLRGKSSFSGAGSCSPANSNTATCMCKQMSNSLFLREGCSQLIWCSLNMQRAPVFEGGRPPTPSARVSPCPREDLKSIEESQRPRKTHLSETEVQRNHSHEHEQTAE